MLISKDFKNLSKISRMIVFLSRFSSSSFIRLISLTSRYNKDSLKTLKSKYSRSMQAKRNVVMWILIVFDLNFRKFNEFIHSTMQNQIKENAWKLSKTQNFTYDLTTKLYVLRMLEIKFHHRKRTITLFKKIWTYQYSDASSLNVEFSSKIVHDEFAIVNIRQQSYRAHLVKASQSND